MNRRAPPLMLAFPGIRSWLQVGWVVVVLAAMCSLAHGADPERDPIDVEMDRVKIALDRVSHEQQSIYQQFVMVQEMQRTEASRGYESQLIYTPPLTPPSYEDLRRREDERQAKLRNYQLEMDRLYNRYKELEEQKRPLLDRLSELAQERAAAR